MLGKGAWGILGLSLRMLAPCLLQDRFFLASWRHLETMLRATNGVGFGALKSKKKPVTTTKVEQSLAAPLHALRAEGTAADKYQFIDLFICAYTL